MEMRLRRRQPMMPLLLTMRMLRKPIRLLLTHLSSGVQTRHE
uniref:Uncharacterized protein n=1 Tax=Arundo donax TaxID=35708 RepID=A0A0A9C013_ARUDO